MRKLPGPLPAALPAPRAPYSAWPRRSAPCASVPAPASAPAPVPLGCRGARAELGRRAAPPGPAVRAGAGRTGGARRAARRPRSRSEPLAAGSRALPCPALPCRSPARPPVAVPAPPLGPPSPSRVLYSGGAVPGSQLGGAAAARVIAETGTRGRWERRAAPLCAQPARHPHSGGRGRAARRPRDAGASGRLVKGGQTDTCREG